MYGNKNHKTNNKSRNRFWIQVVAVWKTFFPLHHTAHIDKDCVSLYLEKNVTSEEKEILCYLFRYQALRARKLEFGCILTLLLTCSVTKADFFCIFKFLFYFKNILLKLNINMKKCTSRTAWCPFRTWTYPYKQHPDHYKPVRSSLQPNFILPSDHKPS